MLNQALVAGYLEIVATADELTIAEDYRNFVITYITDHEVFFVIMVFSDVDHELFHPTK